MSFQTISFAPILARQVPQPRMRPEHYAIAPLGSNRPCIIQPKNDDAGDDTEYAEGSIEILPCSGTTPSISLTWDRFGRITVSGEQSTRAGCSGGGGS